MSNDLRALLAASTLGDRVVYAGVGLLLLLAAALRPALEALEPRLDVTRAYGSTNMQVPNDPWGRPFLYLIPPPGEPGRGWQGSRPYSAGPDGLDQRGGGDDLLVLSSGDWQLVAASPETSLVLLSLAVALGGAWELGRGLRRRMDVPWRGPATEAALAGLIGLPAALAGGAAGVLLPRGIPALEPLVREAEQGLVVPFPVAAGAGAWLVVTLGGLWLRARPVPEPDPTPALDSSQEAAPADRE